MHPAAFATAPLPTHLEERTRRIGEHAENSTGAFVLYWMRTAARGHENLALDAALSLANARRVPVLVYHAVSERYPYASDRHHTFILEGARDVARELRTRGIPYALHVGRPGHRGPHLRSLAERARVVVTEDFPLEPLEAWTRALSDRSCVVAVDTACVVPTRLVGRSYERAFEFKRATQAWRAERVRAPYVDVEPAFPMVTPELPFAPVDPETMDVAELVAQAAIDHSVGPVAHTRGGSLAGYARFSAFVDGGLGDYHRARLDALAPVGQGASRMSAYLHYGHVSPFRIARLASFVGGPGADKYLDELLTWRELAYAFASFAPAVDALEALPEWARTSLLNHASDPRPGIRSWETLARSRTGDRLWDAAQASLRVHGELHNSVRMTWGKALLEWTADPATALAMMIDLNHRYALDGRDPASYGGILWCLGQFDRPFPPDRPILGTVRARSTHDHARRLDVTAYAARVHVPAATWTPRVIVVGAGLAGLSCARALTDHGWNVTVVDKGSRPGGRACSRRDADDVFDHGAQFFTARGAWLGRHVASWEADGVVARWSPRVTRSEGAPAHDAATWWVGTPSMGSLATHLARDLQVETENLVTGLHHDDDGTWSILRSSRNGEPLATLVADALVVAVPAAQAAALLTPVHAELAQTAASASLTPCWAVMLTARGIGDLGADVFEDGRGAVAWAAREASKPGRASGSGEERWVLHASASWSEAHLEDTPVDVARALTDAFVEAHGVRGRAEVLRVRGHRWRYARGQLNEAQGVLFDQSSRLAVCGDWTNRSRIEGAVTSGIAAAGRLLALASEPASRR